MIYFFILGVVIAVVLKRSPVTILTQTTFKAPYLLIGCLVVQILLEISQRNDMHSQYPISLLLTFVGMLAGLYLNRHYQGIRLIFSGTCLNLLAIVLHGGLMPVSESAMQIAGLEDQGFLNDSRHQLMEHSYFWWLGDWIPFFSPFGTNYVFSPGDFLVGIGILLFVVCNSVKRGSFT